MKRIVVAHLNKKFSVSQAPNMSVLSRILTFVVGSFGAPKEARFKRPNKIDVAKDISFDASTGENIGIIGRNGSGKSTLLRLIAEIYTPDSGEIKTEGTLVYLAGFGLGLQPLLTMRENIYLMSAMMGLSQAEVKKRFDEIVEFSGLRDFVDTKVYQFSSGMSARLNFSVTILCIGHRKPDILLLDEVLSGAGDIDFQEKALRKMEDFIRSGSTVVLVSHDLEIIRKYCNRAVWLERGEVVAIGKPDEVVGKYVSTHGKWQ